MHAERNVAEKHKQAILNFSSDSIGDDDYQAKAVA
jgi:hypothetical protein